MRKNSKTAFTMIELSIVMIIIAFIVVGVMAGSSLINSANVANAKVLTKSSPVVGIENLRLWLDTTLEDRFAVDNTSNLVDKPSNGDLIATWKDANLSEIARNRKDLNQSTAANQPSYVEKGINNLPSLFFDGNDALAAALRSDFNFLHGDSDHSIFLVMQKTNSSGVFSCLLGTYNTNTVNVGYIFTTPDTSERFNVAVSNGSGGGTYYYRNNGNTDEIQVGRRYLLTEVKNSSNSFKFVNGNALEVTSITNSPSSADSQDLFSLGALSVAGNAGFTGYIGEVIIYERALGVEEREEVESYLTQKWNISP